MFTRIDTWAEEGESTVEQTFKLIRPGALSGRVIDKTSGKPLANVRILVKHSGAENSSLEPMQLAVASTGEDGRFRVSDLTEKELLVVARRGEPGATARRKVNLVPGGETDAGDISIGEGAAIRGRLVRAPDEAPVADEEVALVQGSTTLRRVRTDSDGSFLFDQLDWGTYSAGATRFCVIAEAADKSGKGFVDNVYMPADGDSAPVTVRLTGELGKLACTVYSMGTEQPINRAKCLILGLHQQFYVPHITDASGAVTLSDIPPGTYQVRVSAERHRPMIRTVEIRAGETTELHEVLVESGTLISTIVNESGNAVSNATLRVTPADSASLQAPQEFVTDATGTHTIHGLLPGSYVLKATAPGGRAAVDTVAIGAGGTEKKRVVLPSRPPPG